MRKYLVLTDSTCDIPEELVRKHGIEVLSFAIMLDGKEYIERKDLTCEQFYQLLDEAEGMPTTAQITPMTFTEAFERYEACLLYTSLSLRFPDAAGRDRQGGQRQLQGPDS